MSISEGRGSFELVHPHIVPGLPHLSMFADGKPFAALYFGTQAEALEESKRVGLPMLRPLPPNQRRQPVVKPAPPWKTPMRTVRK
jgi:hypothetical protein